jgi:hypothetical protein
MGRLTLNMLLSFAQFEREVTAERIRDKIAASKARGMWMGGTPPLGYRPDGGTLAIIDEHARPLVGLRSVAPVRKISGAPSSPSQFTSSLSNVRALAEHRQYEMLDDPLVEAVTGNADAGMR